MSVAAEISAFRTALVAAASGLGLDPKNLWASEDPDRASASADVSPAKLESLDETRISAWRSALHGAFEVRLHLPEEEGGPREMDWPATPDSYDLSSLAALLQEAARFRALVQVQGTLVKERLERRIASVIESEQGSCPENLRIAIFFSGARLEALLSNADYRYFEERFLRASGPAAPDRRLLVLVAEMPGQLSGGFLAVLGNDHLGEAGAFASARVELEPLQAARDLVSQWADPPWLLTPNLLAWHKASPGLEGVKKQLVRLRNELSVGYLANRTERSGQDLIATFEGTRSVQIPILPEPQAETPYDLFRWAFGDTKTARTRLDILRRVLASRLPGERHGFEALVRGGQEFISEAEVQLRLLIDENIVKNFERWQKVEDLARDYSDKGSDRVRALTREVVDNVYKTVGILLGVALAYLLKPDQGPLILLVTVTAYALYVVGVIVGIYLPSLRQEHDAKRRSFLWSAQELRRLRILSVKTRGRLRWVLSENRRFNKTFRRVRRFYILLALIPLIVAILWLDFKRAPEPPERDRALAAQLRRFERLGHQDIRISYPIPLTDVAGAVLLPDLSAVSKTGKLIVVAWVSCSRIENPDELRRLLRLQEAVGLHQAELQLLTEDVCGEDNGPRRLRAWLAGRLPDPVVWTP